MLNQEYKTLTRIFDDTLRGFRYVEDLEQWGKVEDWRLPDDLDQVVGDCDDFAIACLARLREAGIEARLVLCKTERGDWHLVAAADRWVLDNRQNRPRTRQAMERDRYEFVAMSGTEAREPWHLVA